jgi:hypothetical protein
MKFLSQLVLVLATAMPAALFGQGVRMSADFIPLEVGNRWVYEIVNEDGRKIGDLDFSVQQYTIIGGRSFYVLTQFPFAPEGSPIKLIRYDRQERQYMRMADNEEGPLFLADGTKADVLQADESGLPLKFVLRTDLMDLTFQRGVGIVEARMQGSNGVQIAKLTGAHFGEGGTRVGTASTQSVPAPPPVKPPEQRNRALVDNVGKISEDNPVLDVQAVAVPEGHKFALTIVNVSDKLLPFSFKSGQSYDFAVADASTGQEIWRWSLRMFFTQVIRQEAIRPNGRWTFEITWNHRDNNLNLVTPGKYKVVGIVATQPPIESDPVTFEIQ